MAQGQATSREGAKGANYATTYAGGDAVSRGRKGGNAHGPASRGGSTRHRGPASSGKAMCTPTAEPRAPVACAHVLGACGTLGGGGQREQGEAVEKEGVWGLDVWIQVICTNLKHGKAGKLRCTGRCIENVAISKSEKQSKKRRTSHYVDATTLKPFCQQKETLLSPA